jgi:hypothetical protein
MMRSTVLLMICVLFSGCAKPLMISPDALLPNGASYRGETENGLLHGRGELVSPTGHRYQGEFRFGLYHGQGVFEFPDGRVIDGYFEEGFPVRGKFSNDVGVYEGELKNWQFHGEGVYRALDGQWQFSGQFVEGNMEGLGEHQDERRGLVYVGEFASWRYHGQGELRRADGRRLIGRFEYGDPVGEAVIFRPDEQGDEQRVSGVWERGIFIEEGEISPRILRAERVEKILHDNAARLQQAFDKVLPERPGQQDVYYLLVGGDGDDSVFVRDVAVAQAAIHRRFAAEGRGLVLLNDREYAGHPLATRSSIRAALALLASRMNPDEDVLLVHLASHGDRDGSLTLAQPGMSLPDITPDEFRMYLSELSVPNQVLIISACYSGHWLDALASESNLVLTSAHRERTSFGCGDDSEMTWFTRALYQEADLDLANPKALFRKVGRQIERWEKEELEEGKESLPQFHLGKRFVGIRPSPALPERAASVTAEQAPVPGSSSDSSESHLHPANH